MAKPNLLLDRLYLVGNSKINRKRSWPAGGGQQSDSFIGHHPSLKQSYAGNPNADFFRGAGARYWSFNVGGYGPNYADFGYLNKSTYKTGKGAALTDEARFNEDNFSEYISFKFLTDLSFKEIQYINDDIGPLLAMGPLISGFLGFPVAGSATYSNGYAGLGPDWRGNNDGFGGEGMINFSPNTNNPGLNCSRLAQITIYGDSAVWEQGSVATGVEINKEDELYSLNNVVADIWSQYVKGGFENYLIDNKYHGLMSDFYTMYMDHAHRFYTPYGADAPIMNMGAPVAVKVAKISANYNFFIKKYEDAIVGLDERVLPNAYILFNAIDYGPEAEDEDSKLDSNLLSIYNKVSCLWGPGNGSFQTPTNRDQVKNTGYGNEDENSPLYKKSYIQKYYSVDTSKIDFTYVKDRTSHIGFSKAMMQEDFVEYSDGVSGEYFDSTGQLDANKADIYMPYDITIEFDSLMPGVDPWNKFIKLFEEVDGAYDFILQNIMMMNISSSTAWQSKAPLPSQAKSHLYDYKHGFSAQVTDHYAGSAYYGFDWASNRDPAEWGENQKARGGPWKNQGPYNLKTADLALMMGYNNGTRLADDVTLAEAPSPLIGQTVENAVAFGKGIFVGRKKIPPIQGKTTSDRAYLASCGLGQTLSEKSFIQLLQGLAKIIQEKSRNYLEVINGELAYTETIAYKVDKHLITSAGVAEKPIQSFYFPNLTSLNKIRYVDTQVKYAQKYKYKVYAYNIVVGDQYHYKNNLNMQEPIVDAYGNILKARFYVHQFPSVKLIEAPYYEYEPVEVRDLPPVFPEIEMVPFKGVNNKIRILMQTQNVKYAFNPNKFIISESDKDKHDLQRVFQQRPTGPIVFGSDDTQLSFEIYRSTTKPTSYADFDGQLLTTLEGCVPGGIRAVNIAYDDTIEPNQKYYYTFRCIDYHDAISIPSPIYVVEIVDDNGRMFPLVDIFYMANHKEEIGKTCMPLRRYLKIGAALAQSIIPQNRLNGVSLDSEVAPPKGLLGTVGEPNDIWSDMSGGGSTPMGDKKVFKIRLTSRHTGKKIDLNIQFKETPITNPSGEDENTC